MPEERGITALSLSDLFWTKPLAMNLCLEPSPLHQTRAGAAAPAPVPWQRPPAPARSPLPPQGCSRGGTDSSNSASTAQATPRWEDRLAVFPGLSSSDRPSVAHSNSNILTFLCCSASSVMRSLQESFPPEFHDPLMETMKITTRGQSRSRPAKTLQHRPGAVWCIPWTLF